MRKEAKIAIGIGIVCGLLFVVAVIIVYLIGAGKASKGFSNIASDIGKIPIETAPGETYMSEDGDVYHRIQVGSSVIDVAGESLMDYKKFSRNKSLQAALGDLVGGSLKYNKTTFNYEDGICSVKLKDGRTITIDIVAGVTQIDEP